VGNVSIYGIEEKLIMGSFEKRLRPRERKMNENVESIINIDDEGIILVMS
jgi:hypothetical protein